METPVRPIPADDNYIDFVICDNTLNRYGWRLLVEGIDTANFAKNPVCVLAHDTYSIPVGKWENVRVEDGRLLGRLIFDPTDADSVRLYWKYKDGYMSAVSLNVLPTEQSEAPEQMVPGQRYPTVTQSELLEVSCVVLPGQGNAVKLSYADGREYKLSLLIEETMSKPEKTAADMAAEIEGLRKLNAENLVALHRQRGAISDAEMPMLHKLALADYDTTKQMLEAKQVQDKTQEQSGDAKAQLAVQLVRLHLDRGAITAQETEFFQSAAAADYEGTKKVLELRKGRESIGAFGTTGAAGDDRKDWKYLDFYKKDLKALGDMERNDPERYAKLVADATADAKAMNLNV